MGPPSTPGWIDRLREARDAAPAAWRLPHAAALLGLHAATARDPSGAPRAFRDAVSLWEAVVARRALPARRRPRGGSDRPGEGIAVRDEDGTGALVERLKGRVLARDAVTPAGEVVGRAGATVRSLDAARWRDVEQAITRSPWTCRAKEGVAPEGVTVVRGLGALAGRRWKVSHEERVMARARRRRRP